MSEPDYRVSEDPEWQPYRHPETGEVVTVTPHQCNAIFRALNIYLRVAPDNGRNDYVRDAVMRARNDLARISLNSCLMGRLLYDGKAPLVDAPPVKYAAPDYSVEVPRCAGDEN